MLNSNIKHYDIKLSVHSYIKLTFSTALTSAPHLTKLSTIELSPFSEAICNGVR